MLENNSTWLDDRKKPGTGLGAVMVVGGGIAGMQTAIDLADSGFKVFLIEEKTHIGGRMAQLDKTFPTNDCAMCVISPKLIEVDKNINIEILTNTEVMAVDGPVGNFRVTLKEHPRFVDPSKCTSCGDCVKACPVVIPNEYNQGFDLRKAVFKLYPQGIPSAFAITKANRAPCVATCPAGVNIQGYVALTANEKFNEAYNLIIERNPFPSVCGRVCHHPCEGQCNRGEIDTPVAINNLKRFNADWVRKERQQSGFTVERVPADPDKPKIAIVGGGPSGLTAARNLVLDGYPVTVFDARQKLGGAMRWGIPEYRLPEELLDWDIQNIVDLGIEVRLNQELGRDFTLNSLKSDGYGAIYLGVGLPLARRLEIKGHDAEGVLWGMDFLTEVSMGGFPKVGKKVVVIGGGNVALDAAMTARRQGGEDVTIVSLERREDMPAHDWEIEDAVSEGVKILPTWGPSEIFVEDGKVAGIQLIRCLSVLDEKRQFNPRFDNHCLKNLNADTVIITIGQAADLGWVNRDSYIELTRIGIKVNSLTLETNVSGVFAGSDVAYGPRSVVDAIAQGHKAAESIRRFIAGEDMTQGREKEPIPVSDVPRNRPHYKKERAEAKMLPVDEREGNYREIYETFTKEMAVEEAKRCLACGICSECMQCVEACLPGAINHKATAKEKIINVGAVVAAPGFDPYNPSGKPEYGYGRYVNVITSMEMERTFSASGPYKGHVSRPSDHTLPKRIAWIQCVGSRDTSIGKEYCSSVCCTYATKQASLAKDHYGDQVSTTIFLNDLRTFGKGFDRYYNNAVKKYGVRYVNSFISTIKEVGENHNLLVKYVDGRGAIVEEEFDMVVLSVGLVPSASTARLAHALDIEVNEFGFTKQQPLRPGETSRQGIFVAGVFETPRDIPESVMSASSAAALSTELLSESRGALTTHKDYPPETVIEPGNVRIGVFICHCGINIAGIVDVPAVTEYALTLPHVVHAEHNLFTCSTDTQERIKHAVEAQGLTRVIVASCTPRTHEPLFQDTIREAGLNKYLFEMANIRDQCSWVHQSNHEKATEKAKDLVRMAVARSATLEPLYELPFEIDQKALVIGGGVSGMTAALGLAKQGFDSFLVEQSGKLGGHALKLHYTLEGVAPGPFISQLIDDVNGSDRIKVLLNTRITGTTGHVGNFTTQADSAGEPIEIRHGAVIVATGGQEYTPDEYLYGQNANVLTQVELEGMISDTPGLVKAMKNVVMIQCVGSRSEEHPYCSRYCCSAALKNAIRLKELNSSVRVYILYRDIRAYGFKELYYKKAREMGITFIRYDAARKPVVRAESGSPVVTVFDKDLKLSLEIETDLLALSAAIRPSEMGEGIKQIFKLPGDPDNFFLEAHMKLRPLDFASAGVFLCGLAHSPKLLDESITQAKGAVSRACTVLSKKERMVGGIVSHVDPDRCAACLTCVRVCPFDVPKINRDGVAEISSAACQGCGSCVAACPRKAIEVDHYKDDQILSKCAVMYA